MRQRIVEAGRLTNADGVLMKGISNVSAIVFFVKDLARTITWYRDVLGLAIESREAHEGSIAMASLGTTTLVFIPSDERPGRSPVVVLGLDGGIDDVVDGLVKQGVEIVTPVSEAPDGGLTADFLDPDHHVLSVYQPAGAPRRNQG